MLGNSGFWPISQVYNNGKSLALVLYCNGGSLGEIQNVGCEPPGATIQWIFLLWEIIFWELLFFGSGVWRFGSLGFGFYVWRTSETLLKEHSYL